MTHEPVPVLVPLINSNEPESMLAEVMVREGMKVVKGQVLACFETTKSTFELTAEVDGFVLDLKFKVGDTVRAGEQLCYLAATADQRPRIEKSRSPIENQSGSEALPEGLRITRPALDLARATQVDLDSLPKGVLITEKMLSEFSAVTMPEADPVAVLIYGGGGHAKSLIDLIRMEGKYTISGIVDDGIPAGTRILGVPVLGGGELLPSLRQKGIQQVVNAVGGISSITPRLAVYQKLGASGFTCVTVVHPRAFVEPTAVISAGCQLFFNAYVGSSVRIGFGSIINTGAIVSHDCVLGEYVNISPGAILAGAVSVAERALVGMGATINLGVHIGTGARIGNSAVVKADVPENAIVRAGAIWPAD